jgi:MFS family permease
MTADDGHSAGIDLTEFRNGWRVLLLALVGVGTSVSAAPLYAFGALVLPLQEAFGWSRGEIQAAMTFQFAAAVVALQFAGGLNKRWGLRRVTLLSLPLLAVAYLLLTLNRGSLWQFYAGFTLLAFAGLGTMQVTWTQLVNLWFERNRGLALAIILCGTGLAAMVLPSAVTWATAQWGWRAGFWLLASMPLLVTLPLALFWLRSPFDLGAGRAGAAALRQATLVGMSFRQALGQGRFWIVNAALLLAVMAVVGMVTNAVPIMRDYGLSAAEASRAFGAFGVSLVVGRIAVGYLIDRLWAPGVALVVLSMPSIGCYLYATAGADPAMLTLGSMLIGLGAGAEMDLAAFLVARYFGMRDYSRIFSLHLGIVSAGSSLAPLLFAQLLDRTGSYSAMLAWCAVSFALGALLLPALGRYPDFRRAPAGAAAVPVA